MKFDSSPSAMRSNNLLDTNFYKALKRHFLAQRKHKGSTKDTKLDVDDASLCVRWFKSPDLNQYFRVSDARAM